jgi:hypothetical protein
VRRGDDDGKDQSIYGGDESNLRLESQVCYASSLGIEESEKGVVTGAGEGSRAGDASAAAAEGTDVVSDLLVYRGFQAEILGRGKGRGGHIGLKGGRGNVGHVSNRQVQEGVWSDLDNCVGEFGCTTFFIGQPSPHQSQITNPLPPQPSPFQPLNFCLSFKSHPSPVCDICAPWHLS